MTNKVLLGLIVALAIGVVVVGSTDKARQQPAAAITAVSKTVATTDTISDKQALAIVDTANDTKDLSSFVALAQTIDFAALLQEKGGEYTVLAPTNAAFRVYAGGDEKAVLANETKDSLDALLKYHVVAGRYDLATVKDGTTLTTLQGDEVTITHEKGGIVINGVAKAALSGETTGKSVVYAIDEVLTPKESVAVPMGNTPTPETGRKTRERIMCTDNGDGTVTIQDQQQTQFLGFLWWGSWHDVGEPVTGPSATGCNPFPGFHGEEVVKAISDPKNFPAITKDGGMVGGLIQDEKIFPVVTDPKEPEGAKVRRRIMCTDNGDGTVTIQDQVQTQFLGFLWWGSWHDVGEPVTGPSATGCNPFPGFHGEEVVKGNTENPKNFPPLTKEDLGDVKPE